MLRAGLLYLLIAVALASPALLPGKSLSMADQLRLAEPWKSASPPEFEHAALPNSENTDTTLQLQPLLRESVDRLPDAPLWNPHLMNGRPLLADAQSTPFSPFAVPAFFLSDLDSLAWIVILKWWIAALGTFALGRALGMRFAGAFVAGLTYGFCFWMVTFATFPHTGVFACLPWMLLAAEAVTRRPDLVSGAALASVTGIELLAGQPEPSFQVLIVTVLFFGFRLYQRRGAGSPGAGRALATFGLGLTGGLLLAALLVVPFAELLFHSADVGDRSGTAIDAHLPTRWLLGVFLPDYWGRSTKTAVERYQLVRAYYAGALPLMLAAAALIISPRAERIALAGLGVVSLGVVGGIPPFLQVVTRLPVFSGGHNARLIMVWVLSVALLAGWGLDELASSEAQRRRRPVVLTAVAILGLPLAWAFARGLPLDVPGAAVRVALGVAEPAYPLSQFPEARDVIELASVVVWLAVAGTAVLLIVLRARGRLGIAPFVLLATALVAVDLFKAGMGFNPAIDEADARLPRSGAIEALERQPGARFVKQTQLVADNVIALRFGLSEADGYDLPVVERYDSLWRSQIEPECPSQTEGVLGPFCNRLTMTVLTPRALRTLRMLGVQYLLQPPSAARPTLPGLTSVYEGADGRVYRIEGAQPRAWVAGAQEPVRGRGEALAAVSSSSFAPDRAVVTEHRLPGVTVGGSAAAGSASIVRDEPEHVTVRAWTATRGVVVLADTWYPGWRATVDGREVPIAQVDYVLRGVPVGAGAHTVDFRYEPWTWKVGWIASGAAIVMISTAFLVGMRRRRRPGRERLLGC